MSEPKSFDQSFSWAEKVANSILATYQEKYKQAAYHLMGQLREQPCTSEGGYWHKKIYPSQMWLDGVYMAEPVSVEFALTFHESRYFDEAIHQITLIYKHTHDPHTGLLYHGWDESKQQVWAHHLKNAPNKHIRAYWIVTCIWMKTDIFI